MKKVFLSLFVCCLFMLTACNSSIKSRVLKAIKESPITNSYISQNDRNERWRNYKDQEEEVQEKYLIWLDDIADYVSKLELKEINADEFRGSTGMVIKVVEDKHVYVFQQKHIWPDKSFLKFSIDDKDVYYKIADDGGEGLIDLMLVSENSPYNTVSIYDYLDHEQK